MRKTQCIALSLFIGVFDVALAQGGDPWARISKSDTNSDGKVSKAEFKGPQRIFTRFDTNKDGVLTKEEVAEARRGGKGGAGRGPDNAPKTGDKVPQVSAKKLKGEETVNLGKPKRLTVLIFGSYT